VPAFGTINIQTRQAAGGAVEVSHVPIPPLPDYLKEVIEEQKS
jgi:hypothetical protein